MTLFSKFPSYQKLQRLKLHLIDLTLPGALTPERLKKMAIQGVGFQLLYGTERVTQDVLDELFHLSKEAHALEKMRAMQSGEVINCIEGYPSENRAVLHTAMRDQFDNCQTAPPAKKAAEMARLELEKLDRFLEKTHGKFTDLIQIGIGGSDLGPRALAIALQPYYLPGRKVHFISNVDPDDANFVLSQVDLKKTLVVVVSKSGTTLETLTNEEFVRARLSKLGLDPKDHFVAVTGEGSPMDNPARYLASFYIWDFVGGRYSATSMVG
ncbi:MAG: glucose-6-phosphate isomerase, partial [Chlamydiota bacterium]